MNPRTPRFLVFLVLLLAPAVAAAATPRDEALRLVPEDVGFCLVVQDLRGHSAALADSPFVQQFRRSPLGVALASSQEVAKVWALDAHLRKDLRLDWTQLRDDLLGDAVVIAYRPGPAGQMTKQDQDLVVVRARDAKLLADVVDRMNRLQQERKEVTELDARIYQGRTYYRRVDHGHENFYFLRGPILAVSSQEEMLRRVLDLDRQASTAEPHVARQLRLLGADQHLAALWINPQAFVAEMERKAAAAPEQEAAVLRAFLAYWKSIEGAVLSFDVRRDAEIALALRAQSGRLPAAARRFFAALAQTSELWKHFPANALFAVAGRFDTPALLDLLGDFLTTDDRQTLLQTLQAGLGAALDKDVVKDILPNVGPDCGFCVTAPPTEKRAWFPQVLFAVRVRPGEQGAGVDQALLSAVKSFVFLGVFDYNRQHKDQTSLKTERQEPIEIKYLANEAFPPGFNPAFALKDGYLLFASAPDVIRRFAAARPAPPAASTEDIPLLRLSLKDLRQYVQERRVPLVQAIAEKNQLSREEAERRLNGLLLGLEFFDRLEISQRPGPEQLTLTLRLQPAQPFRK
jgi:hypothetical protein